MSIRQRLAGYGLASAGAGVFIMAEGSANPALLARMEFHGAPHRSLWRLELLSGMEKHAPWLAQVDAGTHFDAWLDAAFDTLPVTVVFSHLSFDALWRHLRHFSKFETKEGQRYFLRLADPGSLRTYVDSISRDSSAVSGFFSRGRMDALLFHDPRVALSESVRPVFEPQPPGTIGDGYLVWRAILPQGGV